MKAFIPVFPVKGMLMGWLWCALICGSFTTQVYAQADNWIIKNSANHCPHWTSFWSRPAVSKW